MDRPYSGLPCYRGTIRRSRHGGSAVLNSSLVERAGSRIILKGRATPRLEPTETAQQQRSVTDEFGVSSQHVLCNRLLRRCALAKYGRSASKNVESAMRRRKKGTLKSGSGRKVKSRKQAIAIGLSEAREKGAKVPSPKGSRKSSRKTSRKRATKKR